MILALAVICVLSVFYALYVTIQNRKLRSHLASLQTLWVVGQYRFGDTGAVVWDLQGVFSARDQAVAACKAPNWFIAPIKLDQPLPEKTEVMPDVEWPLLDKGAA